MNTEYKEGNYSEFVEYLYSNNPKPIGSIQLEIPLSDPLKNKELHIFEQLLMIFVDGLKYFYDNGNGKVNLCELNSEKIEKMNNYFKSMNYQIIIDVFKDINEYQFKYPNYLKHPELITNNTAFNDFFYETYDDLNVSYRVSFNNYN